MRIVVADCLITATPICDGYDGVNGGLLAFLLGLPLITLTQNYFLPFAMNLMLKHGECKDLILDYPVIKF